jgi:hypothetical protein
VKAYLMKKCKLPSRQNSAKAPREIAILSQSKINVLVILHQKKKRFLIKLIMLNYVEIIKMVFKF